MITVGHVGKDTGWYLNIYIGRGSPLGNPFYMASESMRDEVCDKYEVYFEEQMALDGPFKAEMRRLYHTAKRHDLNLQCYCAPKRCHGDTIRAFLLLHLNKG